MDGIYLRWNTVVSSLDDVRDGRQCGTTTGHIRIVDHRIAVGIITHDGIHTLLSPTIGATIATGGTHPRRTPHCITRTRARRKRFPHVYNRQC